MDLSELPPLDQLVLGPRKGRKLAAELEMVIDRPLGPEDYDRLVNPPPANGEQALVRIRSSHHQAAQLLAQGFSPTEVGRITGYSNSRISILQGDPAFRELMTHYEAVKEFKFADAMERMNALGMATLEELQERLENDPGSFSNSALVEMTELYLVKSKARTAGAAGVTVPVAVQVHFVRPEGMIVDAEPPGITQGTTRQLPDYYRPGVGEDG